MRYNSKDYYAIESQKYDQDLWQLIKSEWWIQLPADHKARFLLKFAKQLLEAVHLLHTLGVDHRDLKPENIGVVFANDSYDVQIMDMGLLHFTNLFEANKQRLPAPSGLICWRSHPTIWYRDPEMQEQYCDLENMYNTINNKCQKILFFKYHANFSFFSLISFLIHFFFLFQFVSLIVLGSLPWVFCSPTVSEVLM